MLTDELDAEMKRRNNIKNVVLFGIEVKFNENRFCTRAHHAL